MQSYVGSTYRITCGKDWFDVLVTSFDHFQTMEQTFKAGLGELYPRPYNAPCFVLGFSFFDDDRPAPRIGAGLRKGYHLGTSHPDYVPFAWDPTLVVGTDAYDDQMRRGTEHYEEWRECDDNDMHAEQEALFRKQRDCSE